MSELSNWLIQEWTDRFAQVIQSMTGELPEGKAVPAPILTESNVLWWQQEFSVAAGALAWIGAPAATWKEIGSRVLTGAGVEEGTDEDLRSTYSEILNQSLSSLAQALTSRVKREVVCNGGTEARPERHRGASFQVTISFPGQQIELSVVFTQELIQSLRKESARTSTASPATTDEGEPPRALDLLLDVELPISVSFGRTQLPLKDVIKLTTGSIVELNRSVSEPVEIIVNNCVIARGQVVVVEGNFGIRIQQIISRQERLRTLK